MRLILTLTGGGAVAEKDKIRTLSSGSISIGRAAGNDWVLPDPERSLSKTHCTITERGGRFILTDTSTNGIFVNDSPQATERESQTLLKHGDKLVMGDFTITVAAINDAPLGAAEPEPDPGYQPVVPNLGGFPAMGGPVMPAGPLDIDPLDDPFGRPANPAFQHPIAPVAVQPRGIDPFDQVQSRNTSAGGIGPDVDLFRGVEQANDWQGASRPDHTPIVNQAVPPMRTVSAPPGDIDFDALIGDLPGARGGVPMQPAADPFAARPVDPFAARPADPFGQAPMAPPGGLAQAPGGFPAAMPGMFPPAGPPPGFDPAELLADLTGPAAASMPSGGMSSGGMSGGGMSSGGLPGAVAPVATPPQPPTPQAYQPDPFQAPPQAMPPQVMPQQAIPQQAPPVVAPQVVAPAAPQQTPRPDPFQTPPVPLAAAAPEPVMPPPAAVTAAAPSNPFDEPTLRGPSPVAAVAAPAAGAPSAGAGDFRAAFEAFLDGAGVAGAPQIDMADPEAALRAAGSVFRAMAEGLREILISRAAIKSEMRIEATMIAAQGNNALKFSVTPEDAVAALLAPKRRGYMAPLAAAQEAVTDIKEHEIAVMAGVQTALMSLLRRFDPDELEKRLALGGLSAVLPGARKARYWESFRQIYGDITREAEDDFQSVFGRSFAKAYTEQTGKS